MSYEISDVNHGPGSLWYERTYGKLTDQQRELAFAGQELHALMERLSRESMDATTLCKEVMHSLPRYDDPDRIDPNSAAMLAVSTGLEAWRVERLAAREGKGFVAKVPAFSAWKSPGDPTYSYLAVDADTPLALNLEVVTNPASLRRDYVTGAHLFSEEDQERMRVAFAPQDDIAEKLPERPPRYGDPQITWADFEASVSNTASRLAVYPDITGVGSPNNTPPIPGPNS